MTRDLSAILSAIDRHGAETGLWPDRNLARAAREAMLAEPALRARFDDARRLELGLDSVRALIDGEVEKSGAVARVAGVVLAGLPVERISRTAWAAIAATLIVAAGLGVAFEMLRPAADDQRVDMVVLDPLVFGPTERDQR